MKPSTRTTNSPSDVWYALDFETTDPNRYTCGIVGYAWQVFNIRTGKVCEAHYTTDHRPPRFLLRNPVVMHNAGFDLYLTQRLGWQIRGPVYDTYLMAKHVHNNWPAYDLKSLAWYHFNDTYQELLDLKNWFRAQKVNASDEESFDLSKPPESLVSRYCLHDVEVTAKLACLFMPQLIGNYAHEIDQAFIPVTEEMTSWGLCADLDYYKDYMRRGKRRVKYNTVKARERMGIEGNPMGNALREHLKEQGEERETKTKQTRADDVVLRDWADEDPAIGSIQRVRKDTKTLNTYVRNILSVATPWDIRHLNLGIFHPNLIQSGAVTRRFRCRGLLGKNKATVKGNTQNFFKEVMQGIVPRPGYEFWKMDLASIEARMFSAYMDILMGESTFADMYRKDPWFNVYVLVLQKCAGVAEASKKHELYTPYKHGTLGRLYGSSSKRFAIQLRESFELDYTKEDCDGIFKNLDRHFPFIRRFQNMVTQIVREQGYIDDVFGGRYYIPANEAYMGVAYLCQGSAGTVLKWWGNQMRHLMLEADDHMCNTVHDEFDLEMKKGGAKRRVAQYAEILDGLDIFGLPLKAEVKGPLANWGEG